MTVRGRTAASGMTISAGASAGTWDRWEASAAGISAETEAYSTADSTTWEEEEAEAEAAAAAVAAAEAASTTWAPAPRTAFTCEGCPSARRNKTSPM